MEITLTIAFVGILVFLAHLFAGIFSRTKVPDVLLSILIGLCLGPFLRIVSPSHFGAGGSVFTTITLVIILFEGGIGLDLRVLRKAMKGTLRLTTLNFFLGMVIVGFVTLLLTDLAPQSAFMLGAIIASTSFNSSSPSCLTGTTDPSLHDESVIIVLVHKS